MNADNWDNLRERNKMAEEVELTLLRSIPFPHHMPDILPIAREAINKGCGKHLTQAQLDSLRIVREFATYSRFIPNDTCNFITLDRFLISDWWSLDGQTRDEFETLLDFIDDNFVVGSTGK